MNRNKFYIETYGCQMNRSDSTDLAALMMLDGFEEVFSIEHADIIIINTCVVRDHAEQKVYSRLGAIKKKYGTDFKFVVMGCLAQQESDALIKKHPYVNLVVGTHQVSLIPKLLKNNVQTGAFTDFVDYSFLKPYRERSMPFKALVNISHGCNNYCSYCIVPYVRGRETSRPSKEIVDDIKALADSGVVEVLLLGQNVNSYGMEIDDVTFIELLEKISTVQGLKRIRFMTPHPKDFDPHSVKRLFAIDKVVPAMHLPLQSASDHVLTAMNRKYSFRKYMDIIEAVRSYSNEIFLSTDILVGFPGESDQDFEETYKAVNTIRFDDAYTFKYSKRKYTASYNMKNIVSEEVISSRLSRIIDLQRAINIDITRQQVGKRVEVLTEEFSQNSDKEFLCKTASGRFVLVPSENRKLGHFYEVTLTGVKGVTLSGD